MGTGYFSQPIIVQDPDHASTCIGAPSFLANWEASLLTTSTDQFPTIVGSYILLDDEYMQILSVNSQNLYELTVSRGQFGSKPIDHPAGTILYIKLEHVIGNDALCLWHDNVNVTYAPYPYAFSTLTIFLGYNATKLACITKTDDTGAQVCLQPYFGRGNSQVSTHLYLRPGTIFQRHVLSYPAGAFSQTFIEKGSIKFQFNILVPILQTDALHHYQQRQKELYPIVNQRQMQTAVAHRTPPARLQCLPPHRILALCSIFGALSILVSAMGCSSTLSFSTAQAVSLMGSLRFCGLLLWRVPSEHQQL